MLDFTDLPKQWLIAPALPDEAVAGKRDAFAGWQIAAAQAVPVLRLCDAEGTEQGRLIGWVIDGAAFHRADATLRLAPGETPEHRFARLAGRFVMLWRDAAGGLRLREDPSGGLPAIHAPELRAIGSTVTALDQLHALPVDPEIEAIFDFPARRGFLPFGLTPRRGAHRLMPSHELSLADFTTARIWPEAAPARLAPEATAAHVAEAAALLRANMAALLEQGETVLYLSGGHDSRVALAAARGLTARLRAETLGDARALETHVAAQVARAAGIAHRALPLMPCPEPELHAWLVRAGRMMHDPVSRLGPTVCAHDPGTQPLSGTGAEIMRASNWTREDAAADGLGLDRLLARTRMPDHPRIRRAAQDWLAGLPAGDAPLGLDLAKIEQIHGCWSGAAIYGHPLARPSMLPFSGRRLYEIALAMPMEYRLCNGFYHDLMARLWPELGQLPVNRSTGAARLRFWREELRALVPDRVKRAIKPLR